MRKSGDSISVTDIVYEYYLSWDSISRHPTMMCMTLDSMNKMASSTSRSHLNPDSLNQYMSMQQSQDKIVTSSESVKDICRSENVDVILRWLSR